VYIFVIANKQPWEAGGRLVLAVRTVPGIPSEIRMGLGIDNVVLLAKDGDERKITLRTKRFMLVSGSDQIEILLDVIAPVGEYTGLAFTLTSPELRNDWQEDTAPTSISLRGELVQLTSPFHIEEDKTSAIVLGFETFQALYEKDGKELLLPVIQVETRSNSTVTTNEDGRVTIQDGSIEHSGTYGMGWDGIMHYNVRAQREESQTTEGTPEEVEIHLETASSTKVVEEATQQSSTTKEKTLEAEQTPTTTSEVYVEKASEI
jgi:hypothetical protein